MQAYSEIDRWIPPRHTDTNRSKPTAFNAISSKDATWMKSPCNVCGNLGHWKSNYPDIKEPPNGDMQQCNQNNNSENMKSQESSAPKKTRRKITMRNYLYNKQ